MILVNVGLHCYWCFDPVVVERSRILISVVSFSEFLFKFGAESDGILFLSVVLSQNLSRMNIRAPLVMVKNSSVIFTQVCCFGNMTNFATSVAS